MNWSHGGRIQSVYLDTFPSRRGRQKFFPEGRFCLAKRVKKCPWSAAHGGSDRISISQEKQIEARNPTNTLIIFTYFIILYAILYFPGGKCPQNSLYFKECTISSIECCESIFLRLRETKTHFHSKQAKLLRKMAGSKNPFTAVKNRHSQLLIGWTIFSRGESASRPLIGWHICVRFFTIWFFVWVWYLLLLLCFYDNSSKQESSYQCLRSTIRVGVRYWRVKKKHRNYWGTNPSPHGLTDDLCVRAEALSIEIWRRKFMEQPTLHWKTTIWVLVPLCSHFRVHQSAWSQKLLLARWKNFLAST